MIAIIIGRVTRVIVDCVLFLFGLMYSWKRWFEGDIIDWHFDEKVHFFRLLSNVVASQLYHCDTEILCGELGIF